MIKASQIIRLTEVILEESKIQPISPDVINRVATQWFNSIAGLSSTIRVSIDRGLIYLDMKCSKEEFDRLVKLVRMRITNYGWFPSRSVDYSKSRYSIVLSPNYGDLIIPPKFIYHSTKSSNIEKIMKRGIIPQSKEATEYHWSYPPRIFFSLNPPDVYVYKGSSALKVDTSKLRQGTKFYQDPTHDYENSIWTATHIPKEAIIEVIDLWKHDRGEQSD